MTREDIERAGIATMDRNPNVLLELPTGFGKTRLSIILLNHIREREGKPLEVLLLVAKRVHKQNWEAELLKWDADKDVHIHMDCYESLKKHKGRSYDVLLMDEVHHVGSDARLECLGTVTFRYMIGLSATVPRNLKDYFGYHYHVGVISSSLQEAITEDILPEPEIILLPLTLDNREETEVLEVNPKIKGPVLTGHYADYWKYKNQGVHARLKVTKRQYLMQLNKEIDFYKSNYLKTRREAMKMKWLRLCADRLRFLAECKTPIVARILYRKRDCRTLTFCNNIDQAEELGTHSIHSRNADAEGILDRFNAGEINHITAVQMLNEGLNLYNCQYGIFANLNASSTIYKQRFGRLLRHRNPKIIIPYYKGTREEEIKDQMLEGYDPSLIKTFENIEQIL